jgi:hypothetical protein
MDFDVGLLFQMGFQFGERGVWLQRDQALQQCERLLVQGCWIAAAVRKRHEALTRTPEFHHSGDGTTAYAKCISDFVECAFARFISKHQFFS